MINLKTKITTPHLDVTRDFYTGIFGLRILEEWNEPEDRGVILEFGGGAREALLEIYYGPETSDFSGLSLQFKVDDLEGFASALPSHIESRGPVERPWGSTYLYLTDPIGISVIVYQGGW